MTEGFPGQPLQQITLYGPMCQPFGDNQTKASGIFGPGNIVEIEAITTQYATGSEDGRKLFRIV